MNNVFVRVKFGGDDIREIGAHWEVDAEPFDHRGPACLAGNIINKKTLAKRKLVPDSMNGFTFQRVIGAEGYEFQAIENRKVLLEQAEQQFFAARAVHDIESASYWQAEMRKYRR